MKNLLLLACLLALVSCDVKRKNKDDRSKSKKDSKETKTKSFEESFSDYETLDSDGDGLSDEEEEFLGRDINIASLPKISIFDVKDPGLLIEFGDLQKGIKSSVHYSFKDGSKKEDVNLSKKELPQMSLIYNSLVRKKINNLMYQQYFKKEFSRDDFPTIREALLAEVGCIDKKDVLKNDGPLMKGLASLDVTSNSVFFIHKLLFSDVADIHQISLLKSDLLVKDGISENEVLFPNTSAYDNKFLFDDVDQSLYLKDMGRQLFSSLGDEFASILSDKTCMYFRPKDFYYSLGKKNLQYSQVLSKIESKNAHIFLSTENETRWVSLNPKEFRTIEDVLVHFNTSYKIKDDLEFIEVNEIANDIGRGESRSSLTEDFLDKRRWDFVASNNKTIQDDLKAGETYILSLSGMESLVRDSRFSQKIVNDQMFLGSNLKDKSSFSLEDSFVGDRVRIRAKVQAQFSYYGKKSIPDIFHKGYYQKYKKKCWKPRDFVFPRDVGKVIVPTCKRIKDGIGHSERSCVQHRSVKNPKDLEKRFISPVKISAQALNLFVLNSSRSITPSFVGDDYVYYDFKLERNDLRAGRLSFELSNHGISKTKENIRIQNSYKGDHKSISCHKNQKNHVSEFKLPKRYYLYGEIQREGVHR